MVRMLLGEGCSIKAFDPAAMERSREAMPAGPKLEYVNDAYAAAEEADALLILTDWREFEELDLDRMRTTLRYPILIDGRNMFEPAQVAARGLTYYSVGRPAAHPVREDVTANA